MLWETRFFDNYVLGAVKLIVEDHPPEPCAISDHLFIFARIIHGDRFAQVNLKAPEIQFIEIGFDQMNLLIIGRLGEDIHDFTDPIPSP